MNVPIAQIVRQTIRHARKLSEDEIYDWRTARVALTAILADVEVRAPLDPSLDELREFITRNDRDWKEAEKGDR
jgi:hypothetical protein